MESLDPYPDFKTSNDLFYKCMYEERHPKESRKPPVLRINIKSLSRKQLEKEKIRKLRKRNELAEIGIREENLNPAAGNLNPAQSVYSGKTQKGRGDFMGGGGRPEGGHRVSVTTRKLTFASSSKLSYKYLLVWIFGLLR